MGLQSAMSMPAEFVDAELWQNDANVWAYFGSQVLFVFFTTLSCQEQRVAWQNGGRAIKNLFEVLQICWYGKGVGWGGQSRVRSCVRVAAHALCASE